jgi:hypothetical protein
LIPIFTQSSTAVNAITETVSNAIDAGTVGIAVLLAAGLLLLGGLMGLLIWKVIVPLLKQAVEMSSQVGKLIERTNGAIEHSNETNTLQTQATNVQTGEIRLLRGDFKNYQVLQNDTIALLADNITKFESTMVAFGAKLDTAIDHINNNAKDHGDISALVQKAIEEMLTAKREILSEIAKLMPPPAPPTQIELTVKPSQPDAPPASEGEVAA